MGEAVWGISCSGVRGSKGGRGGGRGGGGCGLVWPRLILLPSTRPVLIIRVFCHVDDSETLGFLDEGPSVLRCQGAPFFTCKMKNLELKTISIR